MLNHNEDVYEIPKMANIIYFIENYNIAPLQKSTYKIRAIF